MRERYRRQSEFFFFSRSASKLTLSVLFAVLSLCSLSLARDSHSGEELFEFSQSSRESQEKKAKEGV